MCFHLPCVSISHVFPSPMCFHLPCVSISLMCVGRAVDHAMPGREHVADDISSSRAKIERR
ncbi:hypothetical protein BDU57DRAFT_525061 [Ampelomyces quisqualis]|uniref:Uncharacterized protein n=1 Tax=Ampelomyces quisqualis TaxID=50730 RepID=A0A6A5Q5P1_AMPQU|nr:hypothetical protein BDU57DRAFT_525061 [Ampelomyces quisqualis]